MNKNSFAPHKCIFLIIFFLAQNLCALDLKNIHITGNEFDFFIRGEYNRALIYSVEFSMLNAVELNELITIKGGLALGNTGSGVDIKTHTQGRIGPLFNRPFYVSLAYVYNGLPAYETHTHILLPVFSFLGQRAGITIGPSFRFNRFFGEVTVFESTISFSTYIHLINNERLRIGISLANFNDFYAGLVGSYFLNINSLVHINEQLSLINDIEILQSGSFAMAMNLYGIVYRGGFKFKW